VVDDEGNVYVLGYTQSFGAGEEDILLLKYAVDGVLLWARTWGGGIFDNPAGIDIMSDGSIVVGGNTPNFGAGNDDIFILKYDPDGNLLMQKTWGTPDYERANDMAVDEDDNIYLTGFWLQYGGVADMMICKFSPEGDPLWAKTWGGAGDDRAKCVVVDAEGNPYIAGTPDSDGANYDLALLKYSTDGELLWAKSWGGSGKEGPTGMAVGESNNILIAGATDSFGAGNMDVVLLEWNPSGTLMHAVSWGTSAWDGAATPAPSQSGNIYVACDTKGFEYSRQGVVLEYDSNYELITAMTIQASAAFDALCEDAESNLYIIGGIANTNWTWGDALGVSTDVNGDVANYSAVESILEGTTLAVDGAVSSPLGIEDVGGGGRDALLIKNFPR